MPGDVVGEAWYELGARDEKLRLTLVGAEDKIKSSATAAEQGFGGRLSGAIGAANAKLDAFAQRSTVAGAALRGIGFGAGLSGFNLLTGAASRVVGFFGDAISAASDLNEQISKVGTVFGAAAPKVLAFSETTATSLGISKLAALEAAGTYGNLFVALGITGDAAADMSIKMVTLAGDLASFNNVPIADALQAIQSGLVGETEPLRRFGVNLNDATLREKALSLGLIKTTKDVLPPAIKAQAAYALILDQTKVAQGDYARTSGGLANTQRTLDAELTNISGKLGAVLLPAFLAIVTVLTHGVIPAVEKFGEIIGFLAPGIAAAALVLGAIFVPAMVGATAAAVAFAIATAEIWVPILVAIAAVTAAIVGVSGLINEVAIDFGDMGNRLHKIADATGRSYDDVKKRVKDNMDQLGMSFEEAATAAETSFSDQSAAVNAGADEMQSASYKGQRAMRDLALSATAMEEDFATAFGKLPEDVQTALQKVIDDAGAVVSRSGAQWAARLRDGRTVFVDSLADLTKAIPDSVKEAAAAADREAAKVPKGISDAIIGNLDDLKQVKEEIKKILVSAITDSVALAKNAAILGSADLTKAFAKGGKDTDAELTRIVDQLITSMNLIQPEALETGKGIPANLSAGIRANLTAAIAAVQQLHDQVGSNLSLADFARQLGYSGLADYIAGMAAQKPAAGATAAGIHASVGANLGGSLYGTGYGVGVSYGQGLIASYYNYIDDKAEQIREGVTHILRGAGSPDYTLPREAGIGVGRTYAEALTATLRTSFGPGSLSSVEAALASLSGRSQALAASPASVSAGPGVAPGGAAGAVTAGPSYHIEKHYHLHADGPIAPSVATEPDLIRAMSRVEWFDDNTLASLRAGG